MKKFKNVIYFLSIFILILEISPTLAMEDDEKQAAQNPLQLRGLVETDFELLAQRVNALERTNEALRKEMQDLYAHIGGIIHNKPPIYQELIPTSKLLWMTLFYGFYRCITNFTTFYGQTGSYQYGISMGVDGLFGGVVMGYYLCSLLGVLSTHGMNIPKPPSAERN